MRLEQGDDRRHHARPQPRQKTRLGRNGHRRQPRHPHLAGLCSPWRCCGAHDADAGGGRPMECPGRRIDGLQRRHHACGKQAFDPLRRGCGRGRQADAAGCQVHHAEGSQGLEDRRQAAQAARYGGQARRQQGLRHRSETVRPALRGHQGLPGVRRQAQELRREQGRGHARREEGGAGERYRRRGRRRYLVARQEGARSAADRLG
ncbi:hypothetical protein GALL_540770 [mine drainage metagenome]|uniref:Uncharacterized protein n=1 Tax=mine drainage metagenome TaxID=410659 RepID=A0A1J5PGI6_9ZZZZ